MQKAGETLLSLTDTQTPHSITIEYAGRSDYFAMTTEHFHPHYEVYILLSGERHYFIRDQVYRVHQGDLVFIQKNELHRTLPAELPEHERIVIYFSDLFAERYFADQSEWILSLFQSKPPVLHLSTREQSPIHLLVQQLLRELTVQAHGYELCMQCIVIELLITCARLDRQQPLLPAVTIGSEAHQHMSEVARYIKCHYQQELSLPLLAEQFHLSPSYLSRIFKKTTGFSITEYLNTIRIQEAQRLLRESDLKIIDIANIVGFGNFSHFGKMFKHFSQVSPREYRASIKHVSTIT